MKLVININGHEESLELEEAKEVYDELAKVFTSPLPTVVKEIVQPILPYWWWPTYQPWQPFTIGATTTNVEPLYWVSSSGNISMCVVN